MRLDKDTKFTRPNIKQELNKTTAFMLPALDLQNNKTSYKILEHFGFVNCYLDHKQGIYRKENYLYLLFNPTREAFKKFYTLYEIYKNHPNFVEDYMIDHQLIMVVFKIKEKWKSTYEMFKQSKYSKMSKEYADMFKTVTLSGKVNIGYQYLIIHKHKDYREHLEKELDVEISSNAELMNIIDLTKETFDYARPIKIQLNEGQCQTS
jgi:hypothetical protein